MFVSSLNSVEKRERAFSSTEGMLPLKIATKKIEGFDTCFVEDESIKFVCVQSTRELSGVDSPAFRQ